MSEGFLSDGLSGGGGEWGSFFIGTKLGTGGGAGCPLLFGEDDNVV